MLIDPVCMLTIYPQLLRNFVYKGPNFATISSLLGIVDSLRFVFSRDLMVAEVSRLFLYPHRESHSPTKPSYSIAFFPCTNFSFCSELPRHQCLRPQRPCIVSIRRVFLALPACISLYKIQALGC